MNRMKKIFLCATLTCRGVKGVDNDTPISSKVIMLNNKAAVVHKNSDEMDHVKNSTSLHVADKNKHTKKGEKRKKTDQEKDIYQWFQTYSEVISLLEKKSFRHVDFSQFIQDSLKAAVAQVDAHSSFFSQKSYQATVESTSGEFSGIGVSIISKNPDDEALVVIDAIEGGPAHKAGMQAKDKIVEIDGDKLKGLSSDEVITKLKGKSGTTVKLKVIRDKKPHEFTVTRDIIKDQTSLSYYFKDQDVYYLSLKIFNQIAGEQMERLLKIANEGKCRGIVLDLRRNPGGTLDSAIELAGLFLKKKSIVTITKGSDHKTIATYKTNRDPILTANTPIFILIDNFTASAAEILAGALKYHAQEGTDHKNLMVFLVGTSTFGKGSVQELIPIKNGCALKLTTMLYYLPDESSLQATGIAPDFVIKPKMIPTDEIKWVDELYGKESSLKNHIKIDEICCSDTVDTKNDEDKKKKSLWSRMLDWGGAGGKNTSEDSKKADSEDDNKKKEDKKSFEEKQKERLALDVQVQACVNMISLLNLVKGKAKTRPDMLKFLQKNYLTDTPTVVEKVK